MKKIILALLLHCFALGTIAQSPQKITVLQWNIWQEGSLIPGGFEAIVDELARLHPDFVTFSEVRNYHNTNFLLRLVSALHQRGLTYYTFKSKDSGLLSAHPISDSVYVFPENRDHGSIYKLVTKVKGREFAVYTGHLDYLDCSYYEVRGYDGNTFKPCNRPANVDELLQKNDLSWRDNAAQIFINEAKHDLKAGRCVIFGGDFNEPSHLDWTAATAQLFDHHGMIVPWTVSTMLAKAGYRDAYRVLFPNPLTHPGFTYPCYNPLADIQKLTWAPLSDERERIDLIYYQGRNMRATDAKIFGPDTCVVRCKPEKDTWNDPYLPPKGIWPTDHRGLLVTFEVGK